MMNFDKLTKTNTAIHQAAKMTERAFLKKSAFIRG
jgi:hypothetical protein